MSDLNNVTVIGRMTREVADRDFAYTTNGKARLNLSLAVNDGYGENKYTNYIDVTVWGKTAENIKPYLAKGKQLCVNGRLRQDRWEKDGQKHTRLGIVAESVQLLGGNTTGENNQVPQQAETNGDGFPEDIPF